MIDVEVPHGQVFVAVLALVCVAEHDVLPRQTYGGPTNSFVPTQVQDARNAQGAPDNREAVVAFAHGQTAPGTEIVQFARVVDGVGGISEKQEKRPPRRRDVNRMKVFVERQNRQRQRITTTGRMNRGHVIVDFKGFIETPEGIPVHCIRFEKRLGHLSPWHVPECSNNERLRPVRIQKISRRTAA